MLHQTSGLGRHPFKVMEEIPHGFESRMQYTSGFNSPWEYQVHAAVCKWPKQSDFQSEPLEMGRVGSNPIGSTNGLMSPLGWERDCLSRQNEGSTPSRTALDFFVPCRIFIIYGKETKNNTLSL